MKTIISIDWGGTSIRAVAICDSRVLYLPTIAAANIRTISDEALKTVCNKLREIVPGPLQDVVWLAGAAGAADEQAVRRVTDALQNISPQRSVCHIFPDYVCNHASALGGESGILSINGTGSLVYTDLGPSPRRLGGWGYLLDESPSGAFFGRMTLKAVLEYLDGDETKTAIAKAFGAKHYQPETDKILQDLYRADNQQHHLGHFADILTACYEQNDKTATEIISTSINVLIKQFKQIVNLINRPEPAKIAGCGGLWENWPEFTTWLAGAIKASDLALTIEPPVYRPVFGALIHQARFDSNLQKTFQAIPEKEKLYDRKN